MFEVIWDVEDEVFGGTYSLRVDCETREEAMEFIEQLKHDDLTSNYEVHGYDEY